MMVIFVSMSEKRAIKTTRRVLDAFANRIGENTWQTVITQEGLDMVKRLLRQSASKSTSVSCHWIRSRQISELLWIIGNKNKFDEDGNVPVNSTGRGILKNYAETGWAFMPLVQSLTAVAALMHDIGKASEYFQEKLRKGSSSADPFRHELISALLIQGIHRYYAVQKKDIWNELSSGEIPKLSDLMQYCRDSVNEIKPQYKPFNRNSSTILYCILWLVLSHHRLPLPLNDRGDRITGNDFGNGAAKLSDLFSYITAGFTYRRFVENNNSDVNKFKSDLDSCFVFNSDFSGFSKRWKSDLRKWCSRLTEVSSLIEKCSEEGTLRLILRYARLSLMLGDHFYSSLESDPKWESDCSLYANTNREHGGFRQKLDEHLCGVKNTALKVSHYLPALRNNLPHTGIIRSLKHKSDKKYGWQDHATAAIKEFREKNSDVCGAFILNLAGTGCGKTTANAKIASVMGEEPGTLRFTLALGLRTLTLQTGDEYRDRLHLTDEELAVIIGSGTVQYLHEQDRRHQTNKKLEGTFDGAESLEELFDAETLFEGELPHEGFSTLFKNSSATKMLYSPVLCCTIDQIITATECCRGGRYMLPLLRLMSSDIIIDEVDDFTGNDLKAIGRLIHLCGNLGRKVVLSSATLSPGIAASFFLAYKQGFKNFCTAESKKPDIMTVWIDENDIKLEKINCEKQGQFVPFHNEFTSKQIIRLSKALTLRKGYICECPIKMKEYDEGEKLSETYFSYMLRAALTLHENNHLSDPETKKDISFGAIRLANIDPCVAFAKYLCKCSIPENTAIRVTVYHSRQPLLLRHEQERYLDNVLKRHKETPEVPSILTEPLIRKIIDECNEQKILFIVVCTPVEEVGRDHDYDWAVIEPSSWRSIVQMSGRVNRHRGREITIPNVAVMQYNFKCFMAGNQKYTNNRDLCMYYRCPGYENSSLHMESHDLSNLLQSWNGIINSVDRLVISSPNDNKLAKYEHAVIKKLLLDKDKPDSMLNYPVNCWDLSAITQSLSTFRKSAPAVELTLRHPDPDVEECNFYVHDRERNWIKVDHIYEISNVSSQDLNLYRERLWLNRDYITTAEKYAELYGIRITDLQDRFGKINMPDYKNKNTVKWKYSDIFGMYKSYKEDQTEDD